MTGTRDTPGCDAVDVWHRPHEPPRESNTTPRIFRCRRQYTVIAALECYDVPAGSVDGSVRSAGHRVDVGRQAPEYGLGLLRPDSHHALVADVIDLKDDGRFAWQCDVVCSGEARAVYARMPPDFRWTPQILPARSRER